MAKQVLDESAQALRELAGPEPLERVYLLYGDDSFIVDKIVDAIQMKRFKGKEVDPLSWELYRGDEIEAKKVIDSVRTISLFGGVKVVVYRDIDKLSEGDLQEIVSYVQAPVRAHLVLIATKIDARKKSWTEIKKHAKAISCAPLSEKNVVEYIRSARQNLVFENGAADVLAECIGPNRALIERALEKLSLAITEGQKITPELVEEHVIDIRERSVFELTKSLTKRDIPAALEALRVLLEQRQEPVVINGMLARHARMMLQVKLGLNQRLSDDELMQKIGVNFYGLKEYKEAAKNYSLGELCQFHADVFDIDRTLKSKPVPPSLVLSKLLLSLLKP